MPNTGNSLNPETLREAFSNEDDVQRIAAEVKTMAAEARAEAEADIKRMDAKIAALVNKISGAKCGRCNAIFINPVSFCPHCGMEMSKNTFTRNNKFYGVAFLVGLGIFVFSFIMFMRFVDQKTLSWQWFIILVLALFQMCCLSEVKPNQNAKS
jgi:uncharacterized protein (DUF983 family)